MRGVETTNWNRAFLHRIAECIRRGGRRDPRKGAAPPAVKHFPFILGSRRVDRNSPGSGYGFQRMRRRDHPVADEQKCARRTNGRGEDLLSVVKEGPNGLLLLKANVLHQSSPLPDPHRPAVQALTMNEMSGPCVTCLCN